MNTFDIAFFSFQRDYYNLENGIRNIITNVPNFNKIILVWDDNIDDQKVEFDDIKDRLGYNFEVIRHSELYDFPYEIITWGWIKQQLAKLLCYKYSTADYTWIVDGDILVAGNPELFINNRPIIRYQPHRKASPEYSDFIKIYLGIEDQYPLDLVGSSCLFNNAIVKEIWDRCFEINSKDLVSCVQEHIATRRDQLPFSEFSTFCNYCYTYHRDKFDFVEFNWNYTSEINRLHLPIHIRWMDYHKDIDVARKIVVEGYKNFHKSALL